ncbi:MAG: HAD-IA family hydrolase [Lentisphaeraceae bacterium]|nr:HAD-IA family hydrolase [Lentisphaeraceae bacterium]
MNMPLKALFLDMDETLCDTTKANVEAQEYLRGVINERCAEGFDAAEFVHLYLEGIYKRLSPELREVLLPIRDEEEFRTDLMDILLRNSGWDYLRKDLDDLRQDFDDYRMQVFDFYPGVRDQLLEFRKHYKLVVITNGPIYSQHPKVGQLNLKSFVDAIIIGGEEHEEKPHKSIFEKACRLASCKPEEALHIGDSEAADIQGAVNAGIRSAWINSDGLKSKLADYSFESFSALNLPFLATL